MIQEITIVNWKPEQSFETAKRIHRIKRAYFPDPNVHIDAIGQPTEYTYLINSRLEMS